MKLHDLIPGQKIEGDWFQHAIPLNIVVGKNCKIDSTHCFKNYHSQRAIGLQTGDDVTFIDSSLAIEENGLLKIGNRCYIGNASIVVSQQIEMGDEVFVAGGVTIVDSNFHPIDPVKRMEDVIALSPSGDRTNRPIVEPNPVLIGDRVWIGLNATIMSGVRVGNDVIIEPGAVVLTDVPSGAKVAGNPAKTVE